MTENLHLHGNDTVCCHKLTELKVSLQTRRFLSSLLVFFFILKIFSMHKNLYRSDSHKTDHESGCPGFYCFHVQLCIHIHLHPVQQFKGI